MTDNICNLEASTAEQKFLLMLFERLEKLEDEHKILKDENKILKDENEKLKNNFLEVSDVSEKYIELFGFQQRPKNNNLYEKIILQENLLYQKKFIKNIYYLKNKLPLNIFTIIFNMNNYIITNYLTYLFNGTISKISALKGILQSDSNLNGEFIKWLTKYIDDNKLLEISNKDENNIELLKNYINKL